MIEVCRHYNPEASGTAACRHGDGWGVCLEQKPERECPYKAAIRDYLMNLQAGIPTPCYRWEKGQAIEIAPAKGVEAHGME